jgi:hypothetical protein
MTDKIRTLRVKLRFLKESALVVLILLGFILEFLVELPFRIMAMATGRRRSS